MEVARLDHFLDEGAMRIPRAHLEGAHNDSFDGMSTASSGYTIQEEVERRVTTDVTTKEIKTTTVTDAAGNVVTTKAECHVYPGDTTVTASTARGGSSAMATEASSAYESAYGARSQLRESAETYSSSHLREANEAYASGGSAAYSSSGAAVLRVWWPFRRGESKNSGSDGRERTRGERGRILDWTSRR